MKTGEVIVFLARVRRVLLFVGLLLFAGLLYAALPASSALASITNGQPTGLTIGEVGGDDSSPCHVGGIAYADKNYQVPGPGEGGVITSFSFQSDQANAGQQLAFLALRPTDVGSAINHFTVIGKTPLFTLKGTGVETFPAEIAVQPGDIIGYWAPGELLNCARDVSDGGAFIRAMQASDPSVGDLLQFTGTVTDLDLNESAELVPATPPSMTMDFSPGQVQAGGTSTLTFTLTNPEVNTVAQEGVAFSDTLPSGLVVATPNGLDSHCGGTATAPAGGTSISLAGGSIPAHGTCTVAVHVTATTTGMITNTVSDVSSTNGGTGQPASATLNVVVSSRQHHLAFDPASHNYGHVRLGGALSQTFTLANTGGQGTGALTITVITVSGPQRSFTITATTCHRGLGPRKSCTVTVQFAPTTDGEITGKLTAVGKKPTAMATADLTGTGMRATS